MKEAVPMWTGKMQSHTSRQSLEDSVLMSRILGLVVVHMLSLSFTAGAAITLAASATAAPSVLSFKEWKVDKTSRARARYAKLETEYITKKAVNPKDSGLKTLYLDLKDTKSHVDEISELTVSDYFIGYLSRFKDQRKAFQVAAQKLDSSEVAELMTAYADSLLKTSGEGISTSEASK
jgi:hypothetical protein